MNEANKHKKLRDAVANLIKVKGRYHTEQAFNNLAQVFNDIDIDIYKSNLEIDEHQEFENKILVIYPKVDLSKHDNGDYRNFSVQDMWVGWKIRGDLYK